MPQPLIPWEVCVFPEEIQSELNRRKSNRGFNYINNVEGEWDNIDGDWKSYRGPMSSWVRFCSNGAGKLNPYEGTEYYDKQGFILFGGKNFYSGYGFWREESDRKDSIIGYMPDGSPHFIDNNIVLSNFPIHVPPPEIERINVTIQKELYRRATIEWTCFSAKQLEYMTPYFLVPGISCVLEWGWNHFDPTSLLDLDNISKIKEYWKNPYPLYNKHILKSNGNYDVLMGIVTHFEWSIDTNKIKCKTEITSKDRIYAGLPIETSIVEDLDKNNTNTDNGTNSTNILDSLKTFVLTSLPNIKTISTASDPLNIVIKTQIESTQVSVEQLSPISQLASYLQEEYPLEDKWKKILYGVFYGRDFQEEDIKTTAPKINLGFGGINITASPAKTRAITTDSSEFQSLQYDNKDKDFDRREPNKHVWISMDLLVEILNFHSDKLKGVDDDPMFKIEIDDCVISGHPNLISTNGYKVLIPNSEAPKYFYGAWGSANLNGDELEEYYKLGTSDGKFDRPTFPSNKKDLNKNLLADWKLSKVCKPFGKTVHRDNLDILINKLRYSKLGNSETYEFPFSKDTDAGVNSTMYPRRYSGHLKNIYFNVAEFQSIIQDSSIKTFKDVIDKVLSVISAECGNFWDFKLVNSTGKYVTKNNKKIAAMKIVDNRFVYSANRGKVYTFDYYDSESLIQNIRFVPTLSNSQAIRTIYAETNNKDKKITIADNNELLDYQFKDRLFLDEEVKNKESAPKTKLSSAYFALLNNLQSAIPPEGAFQMTSKTSGGEIIVKRLAIPNGGSDVLKLLLDDGDTENNPKYLGIMPGIQAQITIQGIGGLRTFMMFLIKNLPEPYSHKNIVFRIIDLNESIENGMWTTTITAGIIPLRKRIKERLGIDENI